MAAAVIVNLHAGGGAARRRWPAVARLLKERLGPLAAHFTEGPGHAILLAHQLAGAGFDPLIAAGGDGTWNEVVNGVLSSASGARIGLLPLAKGGDFARSIGLTGPRHAIETLATGEVLVSEDAGGLVTIMKVSWPPDIALPFSLLVKYYIEKSGKLAESESLPGGYSVKYKNEADLLSLFNQYRKPFR